MGEFAMSSVDTSSFEQAPSTERKRWETPVVILASAQLNTRAFTTSGVDGISSTGSPYGSLARGRPPAAVALKIVAIEPGDEARLGEHEHGEAEPDTLAFPVVRRCVADHRAERRDVEIARHRLVPLH